MAIGNFCVCDGQVAEAALADECVTTGDRLSLQRRVLRLGKPPRRWRRPPWASSVKWEPPVLTLTGRPLESVIGDRPTRWPNHDPNHLKLILGISAFGNHTRLLQAVLECRHLVVHVIVAVSSRMAGLWKSL